MCRDGAEEWSENSGTLRNNATLVDLGVANQALQHEDIEVAILTKFVMHSAPEFHAQSAPEHVATAV